MKKGTVAGILLLVLLFGLSVFIAGKANGYEIGFNTPNSSITDAHEIAAMSRFYVTTENDVVKKEILNYVGVKYKNFNIVFFEKLSTNDCLGPIRCVEDFWVDAINEVAKSETKSTEASK